MATTAVFKNRVQFIRLVLSERTRKSVLRMISELIYLTFLNRAIPSFYFTRRLFMKEKKEIKNYLPNKFLYGIAGRINDLGAADVLSNKLYFDLYYRRFTEQLPKILSYNHNHFFVTGSRDQSINNLEDFNALLKDLVFQHSESGSVFIKKMYDSYGGRNTYRLSREDFPLAAERLKSMYSDVVSSAYLFQETIIQHPEMDRINPSCINSIRIDTFVDKDGSSEILSALLRMSITNSHVDNATSGGCYVGIDSASGNLSKYGYSFITVTGGAVFTHHPVTGTLFEGFKIPYFEELQTLVLNVARLVPSLRLIGWDVAITRNGPVLMEGNCGYDITLNDMIYGGYRANPGFRKVLAELNQKSILN